MGFAGNLRTLSLAEVFQTLNRIRATGALRIVGESGGREVVFQDGEITGVSSSDGAERQTLLRRLVAENKLDAAFAAQISSGGSESQVVAALVEQGLVQDAEIAAAKQARGEEAVCELATWEHGDFVFVDAVASEPGVVAAVERAALRPLQLGVNKVLLEAARRLDDWRRLQERIPRDDLVLGPAQGQDEALRAAAAGFPGSAVVPLVDAVRTVEDVVAESVANRIDVYAVIVDLLDRGCFAILGYDDIVYHGDHLLSQDDHARAARLYRRALAERPDDGAVMGKLAQALERTGDAPEAAGCHAQLALAYVVAQQPQPALACAQRAIALNGRDIRLRHVLVRCLIAGGDQDQAVAELRRLVGDYLAAGRLEDARGTCLKILELAPGDELARRELARIFSHAEQDGGSEDVVVCVGCGHVNHREATTCEECHASLLLSCMSCGRVVAVSDRLCIFCGSAPHAGGSLRRPGGSPATSRIIDPRRVRKAVGEAQLSQLREQLAAQHQRAKDAEQAGDLKTALAAWRELAAVQVDNPDLQSHIRSLELRLHDDYVERKIERGHQMRRVRRFFAATSCYRAALRTMPSNDPRAPRLVELLRSSSRSHVIATTLYGAVLVALAGTGWLIARPWVQLKAFRAEAELVSGRVDALTGDAAALNDLDRAFAALAEQADAVAARKQREQAFERYEALRATYQARRLVLAQAELKRIDGLLVAGRTDQVHAALASYRAAFGDGELMTQRLPLEQRLARIEDERKGEEQRRREAPQRLAAAKAMEAEGRLAEALAGYELAAASPDAALAQEAQALAAPLRQRRDELRAQLETVQTQRTTDLAATVRNAGALAPALRAWGADLAQRAEELAADAKRRQEAATAAFTALPTDAPAATLEAWLTEHPGAERAPAVRQRLEAVRRRGQAVEDGIARYREALSAGRAETAWRLARELLAAHGAALLGDRVHLPLVVESEPPGAQVALDGKAVGAAPQTLRLPLSAAGVVSVSHAGYEAVSRPATELVGDWRWSAPLPRERAFASIELGRPALLLAPFAAGAIAATAEQLVVIDARGRRGAGFALGGGDLSGRGLRHAPAPTADGGLVLGLPLQDLVVLDRELRETARIPTTAPVVGRPLLYSTPIFGPGARLAYGADGLFGGPLGKEPRRLPGPTQVISGPVAIARDPDRILVAIDHQCRVVAIEDSGRKAAWPPVQLEATDVGQLVPLAPGMVVTLLDGSRLTCLRLTTTGAVQRWTKGFTRPVVGEPVAIGDQVLLATDREVLRFDADGGARATLPSPVAEPARISCAPAAAGALVVIGCDDGTVQLVRDGRPAWRSRVAGAVTAVAITPTAILAATADGRVHGLRP